MSDPRKRPSLRAATVLLAPLLAGGAALSSLPSQGRVQEQEPRDEAFEKVDPYTKGDARAIERAGYLNYGPFAWAEGVRSTDVAEAIGGCDVLWLETPHFRIGSTLQGYRLHNDTREQKALDGELARLKSKLASWQAPRGRLDPWLRLHLYALRLEDVHEDFVTRFGFDGGKTKTLSKPPGPNAPEPPQKIRVLLVAKTSHLSRYLQHFASREFTGYDRTVLPGGAQFLGVDEEGMRAAGYELDVGLHCVVAGAAVHSLVENVTGSHGTCPLWLEYGLDHVVTRGIDERFPMAPANTVRFEDESTFRWETRVRGLAVNGVAASWADMAAWQRYAEIQPAGHLVAWSRVAWLLKRKPAELRAFLEAVCATPPAGTNGEIQKTSPERQSAAAKAAFGKSLEELETEWRKQASR